MYSAHSPKPSRRTEHNSARTSPATRMMSPSRHRKPTGTSRSETGSPLTLENLQSVNAAYSQTFLTEGRDRASSPPHTTLHGRSSSLTNVRIGSRDRSYERTGDVYEREYATLRNHRHALPRGRSLERGGEQYGLPFSTSDRWYLDPHDMEPERSHSQASSYTERFGYRDSQLILDLQAQICELQRECSILHQDLDQANQKLSSSMNSIKTFWSPELKKERAMRKEEATKYVMMSEQLRLAQSENQKHISAISHLQEELRGQHDLNRNLQDSLNGSGRSLSSLGDVDALRTEKDAQGKELYLLRETVKEMEIRIETQKQTLSAREESIKKLLEMLQSKGLSTKVMEDEILELEKVKGRIIESDTKAKHLETNIQQKDDEIKSLHEELKRTKDKVTRFESGSFPKPSTLQAIIETKDSHIETLEREVKMLQDQVSRGRETTGSLYDLTGVDGERSQPDGISMREVDELRNQDRALKIRVDELKTDVAKKSSEILGMRTHMETLKKQLSDYQHHVAVLKESLSAKEQHTSMLQTDLETMRFKLEEKNAVIEAKTQQMLAATSERNRMSGELHELRDHMDIKERKINVLQRKIENLEDLIQEKDKQLEGVKQKLGTLQVDQPSNAAVTQLEELLKEKEEQIDRLKQQRERMERERMEELEAHQKACRELRERAERVKVELDDHDVHTEELKLEMESVNKENLEKSTKILQLDSEIVQLKDHVTQLEIQLSKAEADKQALQSQQAQSQERGEESTLLQNRIENLEDKIGHYIEQLDKSQNEVDRLLDILKEMEEEKNEKEKQLSDLQEQLKDQNKKLSAQKRSQQADKKKNAQLLEEARKRENDLSQSSEDIQKVMKEKDERVEELEEALRESVKITAEREMAIAEKEAKLNEAIAKVDDLQKQLNDANEAKNNKDERLMSLKAERHRQLAELSEMKQEALRAAISEKDANIALLEMVSPKPVHPKATEDLKRLRREKEDLMKKLKDESERGMKLMNEFKEHEKQMLTTPNSNAKTAAKTPEGGKLIKR